MLSIIDITDKYNERFLRSIAEYMIDCENTPRSLLHITTQLLETNGLVCIAFVSLLIITGNTNNDNILMLGTIGSSECNDIMLIGFRCKYARYCWCNGMLHHEKRRPITARSINGRNTSNTRIYKRSILIKY